MLLITRVAVPVLVSVNVRGELVVFTAWLPNVRLLGDNPTAGLFGLTVKEALCELLL